MTATDTARTGLNRLRLAGDLELNMFTLPILQPGRNTMQFTAVSRQADDNPRLTICWDDRDGAERTCVRDLSGLQDDYVIETNARNPDDIRMRYLLWENPVSG